MTVLEQEERLKLFIKANWKCKVCGGYLNRYGTPQQAHRISQTKYYIKKYSKDVMHHYLNVVPVCSLKCNSKVAIGKSKTKTIEKLVQKIQKDLAINS